MEGSCEHGNGSPSLIRIGNSLVSERLAASREGLSSTDLLYRTNIYFSISL
jgi:hypothetical protein